jgi:epoxide hydrolase 4
MGTSAALPCGLFLGVTLPPATLPPDLEHRNATVNGINMHYVSAGSGPVVVLLHGFPEFWYSWRHQIAGLADSFRVVAPDLRGYNETENRGPYDTATLEADVLSLLTHLGVERAHIVGHDWGAALAWQLAMNHPDAVHTLTICNVPHPVLFTKGLRQPSQLLKSWYVFAFQIPWLPERLIALDNYRRLARQMIRQARPGTFTRDDVKAFLAAWRRQGLGGGINWYRAVIRKRPQLPNPVPVIKAPTLMIWGEDDPFLGKELTYGTENYVRDLTLRYLPGTGHWVQQEEPDVVTSMLREHLSRAGAE